MRASALFILVFMRSFFSCCKKGESRAVIPVTLKGSTRDGNYSFTVTDQTGKVLAAESNVTVNREYVLKEVKDGEVLTVKFDFHRMCSLVITTFGRSRSSYNYALDGDFSGQFVQPVNADQENMWWQ